MAQITRITSEALQATIRRLLPSQQGFGEDLQASNVITPIIDLTPTAEGSGLPSYLQTAYSFTSASVFETNNNTQTVANTAGFWKIDIASVVNSSNAANQEINLAIDSGVAQKTFYRHYQRLSTDRFTSLKADFVVFLESGHSILLSSNSASANATCVVRQIADVNGNLINPAGFNPQ